MLFFFFFKQKTAYEMRISDWSSDVCSSDLVRIGGETTNKLSDSRRTELRRGTIGFVYQYHHLLPEFSALENIVLPQMIAGVSRRKIGRASCRERVCQYV